MNQSIYRTVIAAVIAAGSLATATAAPLTSGNLLIYRVGDGTTAVTTANAAPVYLDEFTTSGTLVQSIWMGAVFSAVGNATTEGILTPSQDGSSVIFTGYNKAPGGTTPAGDTYLTTPRMIGSLSLSSGAVMTYSIANDNGGTGANTIRSATSKDGSSAFWVATSQRVGYIGSPTATGNGTTQIDPAQLPPSVAKRRPVICLQRLNGRYWQSAELRHAAHRRNSPHTRSQFSLY